MLRIERQSINRHRTLVNSSHDSLDKESCHGSIVSDIDIDRSIPLRRFNILFIENSIGLSGSTISLCNIVSHIDKDIFQPYVIFSRGEQENYFRKCFTASISSTVIQCGDSLKSRRLAMRLISLVEKIASPVKRIVYSLISMLDTLFVVVPYCTRLYLFARSKNIDLIHQNNGFDVAAIFLAALIRKPIIAFQRGDEWNSPMVRFLSRFVDFYIANSMTTKKSLLSLGISPDKIMVIYPPIDFMRFNHRVDAAAQRFEFGVNESQRCFGIIGNLAAWKGHEVFLRAAAHVMKKLPNALAFIIGDAPDGNITRKQELVAMAEEVGIRDRVIFTGFRHDVHQLMKILDVVVHSSITPEPFGRVIVEAMAMKKPVVASNIGGPTEIICHKKNGFLFSPGDEKQLAEMVINILTDEQLARRIGHQAYKEVEDKYSIASHVADVQKVYMAFFHEW